jgi:hypothetical protein
MMTSHNNFVAFAASTLTYGVKVFLYTECNPYLAGIAGSRFSPYSIYTVRMHLPMPALRVCVSHGCLAAVVLVALLAIPGGAFSPAPRSTSTFSLQSWSEIDNLHDRPVRPAVCPPVRPPVPWTPDRTTPEAAQLRRVTGLVERLLSIILSADDVALSEREAVKMGVVYMDARGNMTRSPVLLRQQTRDLMLEYGIEPQLVQRRWQLQRHTASKADE